MTNSSVDAESKLLEELKDATQNDFLWKKHESDFLTKFSSLLRTEQGIGFLYDHIEKIVNAGIFKGTSWQDVEHLVPALVKGTLCSGYPMVIYESISEIRMLKLALGEWSTPECSQANAQQFLQEALIASFDLVFQKGGEATRHQLTPNSLKRLQLLFEFILKRMPIESFKDKLSQEIQEISAHRPIVTKRLKEMLLLVKNNYDLNKEIESKSVLVFFVNAAFHPTELTKECLDVEKYRTKLLSISTQSIVAEAQEMASKMNQTGLVSDFHVVLLEVLVSRDISLVPDALALNAHGRAEFERHQKLVLQILEEYVVLGNEEVVFGLSRMLNRNLLSRQTVLQSLKKLLHTQITPSVRHRVLGGRSDDHHLSAKQLIIGGIIRMFGQPLGVGQGMNPTCQSARGLSMWSRHYPGKLLSILVEAVVADEIKFRYQGELISSSFLTNTKQFDYDLDPVSVVLVPLLDNIYIQMIQKAQFKFPFQDPHVTVNPAFYGLWVPTGFALCYNPALNAVQDYEKFVRLFYSIFHPDYNQGFRLVYPLPLGIFITTARAELLGYHAISLLRIGRNAHGEVRAYFFNPNNDGRQNWGQGIKPTVMGNGERHGESSLPFYQLLSRIYAFHYNTIEAESADDKQVPQEEIEMVKKLAMESWGKKYFWD